MNVQFVIIGNLFFVNALRLRRYQQEQSLMEEEQDHHADEYLCRMASDPLSIVSKDYQNSHYNFPFHGSMVW